MSMITSPESMRETSAPTPAFHFITPVWGAEYTRAFIEICLPTLLAPGNIPALAEMPDCIYHIFTSPADRQLIEDSAAFRELRQHIRVEFHPIRAHVEAIKIQYYVQSDCYRRGIRNADAAGAAMIFLNADVVIADGGIRTLLALARRGKRAILAMGVRLNKRAIVEQLQAYRSDRGSVAVTVSPRDLARISTVNLHQISRMHLYRNPDEDFHPAGLFWKVGDEGLLMRCFHLHPLLVLPRHKNAPFTTTIDNDYLLAACPDPDDTYIIQDSDEFLACELSDEARRIHGMTRSNDDTDIARWAFHNANEQHRDLLTIPIRMHAGTVSSPQWQEALAESDAVVARVLGLLKAPDLLGSDSDIQRISGHAARPAAVALRLVTVLASEDDARSFADVTLPSLLSLGNIPAIPNPAACRYTIHTTEAGRRTLEGSEAFVILGEYINIDIQPIASDAAAQRSLYRGMAQDAAALDAAVLFIAPTMAFADDSIRAMIRRLQDGKRAILAPALRVTRAETVGALRREFRAGGVISVASEELVELARHRLHGDMQTRFSGDDREVFTGDGFVWRVGEEGFLLRSFRLQPILVYPRTADDSNDNFGISADDVHIVTDSREMVWVEMVDADPGLTVPWRFSRDFITATTHLYTSQQTPELWQAAAARAASVLAGVLDAAREDVAGAAERPPAWTTYRVVRDIVPVLSTYEHNALDVLRDRRRYAPQTAGAWVVVIAAAAYVMLFRIARFCGRWASRALTFGRRRLRGG